LTPGSEFGPQHGVEAAKNWWCGRYRWWSTPKHCRSCRRAQNHWGGMSLRATSRSTRRRRRCGTGIDPARYSPSASPRGDLFTPRIGGAGAGARGVFPLRLGWQPPTGPPSVCRGVGIRDLYYRVVGLAGDIGSGPERTAPVRVRHPRPPLVPVDREAVDGHGADGGFLGVEAP